MFCYQKNFSNPTLPVDEAQFYALVTAKQWNENIDKYRETGEASLKRKLPAFIFQATFDETTSKTGKTGAWRKQSATRLTGLVVMDIDHVDDPRAVFEGWGIGDPSTTLGMTKGGARDDKSRILLVYVTPSGKGLKVVFKADASLGNLIDNQHAMAKVLDVEVDECCRDSSRMSYVCKESDILYLDKELFTYENKAFSERYTALYRDGHSQATNEDGGDLSTALEVTSGLSSRLSEAHGEISEEKSFKGLPYTTIIDEWWKRNGGVPQEGERNVKLYQLAVSLRAICDNSRELLMQVMPRLGLEEQELLGLSKQLTEKVAMGTALDEYLTSAIEKKRAEGGEEEKVQFVEEEVLFPLRQRIMDFQQLQAVSQQGVVALDVIRRNNNELVRAVDRAKSVTVSSLRTAVTVAGALYNQKLVLEKVNLLNQSTNEMIAATSNMLKTQGVEIQKQSSEAMISTDTLNIVSKL